MSILKDYVGEVNEELSRAAAVGIKLVPSETLKPENIAVQSRLMLDRLLTSEFLRSLPEDSMGAAEELKTVLQRTAMVAG